MKGHYTAGQYLEKAIPGAKMVALDKVNPADRKGVTFDQVVDDMVKQGAKLIFATSDDFQDDTRTSAQADACAYGCSAIVRSAPLWPATVNV